MKYSIFDGRLGMLSDDRIIEANSPKEALTIAGYTNIKRDTTGRIGTIVVNHFCRRGSYVYSATLPEGIKGVYH